MPSSTEQALVALVAAIATQAGLPSPAIPLPSRNETLPTRFAAFGNVAAFLNVNDGDGRVEDTSLGNPDETLKVYELKHRAEIEWTVQAADKAAAAAALDAGLIALNDALAADRTLGGVVDYAEVDETVRSNLVTDALPNTKAIVVYVALSFVSARPF